MDAFWRGVRATPAPAIPNFSMLESAVAGVVEHILYQNELGSKQVAKLAGLLAEAQNVTVLRYVRLGLRLGLWLRLLK